MTQLWKYLAIDNDFADLAGRNRALLACSRWLAET
jgi:hypothetical protein